MPLLHEMSDQDSSIRPPLVIASCITVASCLSDSSHFLPSHGTWSCWVPLHSLASVLGTCWLEDTEQGQASVRLYLFSGAWTWGTTRSNGSVPEPITNGCQGLAQHVPSLEG